MSVSLLVDQQKWPGVASVAVEPGIRDTISLALRLQPRSCSLCLLLGKVRYENDESTTRSPSNRKRDDCGGLALVRPRGLSPAWLGFRPERVAELRS